MKWHFRMWFALAAVALLAGCGGSSGREQNSVDMRVVHLVPDAEPLDVLVNDEVKAAGVAFETTSPFVNFPFGDRTLTVRSAVRGDVLATQAAQFGPNGVYTVFLFGRRAAVTPLILLDDSTLVTSGRFRVRFVSLSAEAPAVDLYLTSNIAAVAPDITGLGYGSLSGYLELPEGNYPIVFTTTGTKDVVFTTSAQAFAGTKRYTVVVTPSTGGALANALVQIGGSDITFLRNGLARLKAVNAVPDSVPLNFKADGTLLLSNVPYGGTSDYVTLASGSHTLQLERASVPGTTIASLSKSLEPARDYTLAAAGTSSTPQLVAFEDDNSLPTAVNLARVRFMNLRADGGAAEVSVDGAPRATNVAALTASPYFDVATGSAHTITFTTPGSGALLATLGDVSLQSGGVYTIQLLGTAGALSTRVARDR